MSNARIVWKLPTARKGSAKPLPIAQIKHTVVELTVDGTNFAVLGSVPSVAKQELVQTELEGGDYAVRLTVVDTGDRKSDPVTKAFAVPFAPPGVVTDVVVTVE